MNSQNDFDEPLNGEIDTIHSLSINVEERELYFFGEIDESSAASFVKNLNYLNGISDEPITIYCNSRGGDMALGFGIYDLLRLSKAKIIFINYGCVASMGTIVSQAAALRLLLPSTTFLIHEGSIEMEETEAKTAISNIQSLRLYVSLIYDTYFSSCKRGPFFKGKTDKFIKSYLKRTLQKKSDWYLNANEIINYGFADGILGSENYKNLSEVKKKVYHVNDEDFTYTI